jgi:hypothetical protein
MDIVKVDGDYVFSVKPLVLPATIQYLPVRSVLLPSLSVEADREEKMEFQIYRSENRIIVASQAIIAAEERAE